VPLLVIVDEPAVGDVGNSGIAGVACTLKGDGVTGSQVPDDRAARGARISEDNRTAASGRGISNNSVAGGARTLESDGRCKEIVCNNGIASSARALESDCTAALIFEIGTTRGTAIEHNCSASIAVVNRGVACCTVVGELQCPSRKDNNTLGRAGRILGNAATDQVKSAKNTDAVARRSTQELELVESVG